MYGRVFWHFAVICRFTKTHMHMNALELLHCAVVQYKVTVCSAIPVCGCPCCVCVRVHYLSLFARYNSSHTMTNQHATTPNIHNDVSMRSGIVARVRNFIRQSNQRYCSYVAQRVGTVYQLIGESINVDLYYKHSVEWRRYIAYAIVAIMRRNFWIFNSIYVKWMGKKWRLFIYRILPKWMSLIIGHRNIWLRHVRYMRQCEFVEASEVRTQTSNKPNAR